MDKSDIKLKEEENNIGNWILAIIFTGLLAFMIFQLFSSFNEEPIVKWHYYYSIIGYAWGLIFVSIFLYFTIRNLIK
tara:strand:+ start:1035 stop:1265 length:231 start_codon:yes stop_codon:yes gene_type:complete